MLIKLEMIINQISKCIARNLIFTQLLLTGHVTWKQRLHENMNY